MKVPGFYSLVLEDPEAVTRAWIPFLKPAGLFVATRREHALAEELVLLVQLPGGAKHSVAGRVAWISAEGRSRGRRQGIGVVLEEAEKHTVIKEIKSHLDQELPPESGLLAQC